MTKKAAIKSLQAAMTAMQDDPELEEVDTMSLMEDAISDALEHFTGVRRTTRQDDEEETDEDEDDDANREMGLPEGEDWGHK